MIHNTCPSCGGDKIKVFFTIKNAPIFSIVTVKSKEEALSIPRKDIELAFCKSCGFIFNRLFDTNIDFFTGGYEDQQGFSETFMNYLNGISQELIKKYNLEYKTCLEIGSGKGDFINLLTNLTQGKGVGIDPAYEEGRQSNPKLTFYKEYYKKKHGKINADFICSRHTLEHIHDTGKFIKLLRDSLNNNMDTVLFFEVPQIKRILDIQAFWDIYYEHCSYFSAASLARLLRKYNFEVLDLKFAYENQYVLIEAKPTNVKPKNIFKIEESIEELEHSIEIFKKAIEKQMEKWRNILTSLKNLNKKTVIWGGGSKSVGFLTAFSDIKLIEYVVDINPHIYGNYIPGIAIMYVNPLFLVNYKPDSVIIMNDIYKEEITKNLNELGIFPDIFVL